MPNDAHEDLYGGYRLRRDDHDPAYYEHTEQKSPNGTTNVKNLQDDLRLLGFALVDKSEAGHFDWWTEFAVREFQTYAKFDFLAKRSDTGNLSRTRNDAKLTREWRSLAGFIPLPTRRPICGVVDSPTRKTILIWKQKGYRCPVIIEAWSMVNPEPQTPNLPRHLWTRADLQRENIWLHTEPASTAWRVFARDFSGQYEDFMRSHTLRPDEESTADYSRIVLGERHEKQEYGWNGPYSDPLSHRWEEAEVLPDKLMGYRWGFLLPKQQSTYRVVRAVAQAEIGGYFDAINAYDSVTISVGLYHWTIAGIIVVQPTHAPGELPGYLAYLQHAYRSAFRQVAEEFGLSVDPSWKWDGKDLFEQGKDKPVDGTLRKYAGWVCLQKADGSYDRFEYAGDKLNYFRTWHWFYRFIMAARTNDGFIQAMWDMARIRIRDILNTPFPTAVGPWKKGALIGDVFTSEAAVAMMLRWHVIDPPRIVANNMAGDKTIQIVTKVADEQRLIDAGEPEGWTAEFGTQVEKALVVKIRELGKNVSGLETAYNWGPAEFGGRLSDERGSFWPKLFDTDGLPLPPY